MLKILEQLRRAARKFAKENKWVEGVVVYSWRSVRKVDLSRLDHVSDCPFDENAGLSSSLYGPEEHEIWIGVLQKEGYGWNLDLGEKRWLHRLRCIATFGLSLCSENIVVQTRLIPEPEPEAEPEVFYDLLQKGAKNAQGLVLKKLPKKN